MQTPKLLIQVNSAGPAPTAARPKNAADGASQFSQNLLREQELRKSQMIPPATQGAPKPAAQAKAPAPAKVPEKAPAPNNAALETARKADVKTAKTETAEHADEASADAAASAAAAAAAAATAVAATPMADMLALVASFNQVAPTVLAPAVTGPLPGAEEPLAGATVRGAIELPLEVAVQLPLAAKNLVAGQPLTDIAPAATGTIAPAPALAEVADKTFTNMMAQADPSALDGQKQAAPNAAGDSGRTFGAALPLAALERAANRPGTEPAAPNLLKAMPEPAQLGAARGREMAADIAPLKDLQGPAPVTAPLQQAALSLAQAVNGAPAGDRLPARVGTPAWDNQVAQKIVWMVGGAEQSASLTLNPPDLGPLQVVLSVTNDMATVTFSSAQPEVRQALEDALPKLRDMMSENGIALGNASVNDGARGQQSDGQSARQGGAAQREEALTDATNGSASEAAAKNAARPARAGETAGLVDTFA